MEAYRAFLNQTQKVVNGIAKLKLYRGSATVLGRKSPNSLYNPDQSSFEGNTDFAPSDSGGFININGHRLVSWSQVHGRLAQRV
jgi:argininosuccinate synthase